MTTKRAGKGYYKGKGGRKEGKINNKGLYIAATSPVTVVHSSRCLFCSEVHCGPLEKNGADRARSNGFQGLLVCAVLANRRLILCLYLIVIPVEGIRAAHRQEKY